MPSCSEFSPRKGKSAGILEKLRSELIQRSECELKQHEGWIIVVAVILHPDCFSAVKGLVF